MAYTYNSPVNFSDPTGHIPCGLLLGAGVACNEPTPEEKRDARLAEIAAEQAYANATAAAGPYRPADSQAFPIQIQNATVQISTSIVACAYGTDYICGFETSTFSHGTFISDTEILTHGHDVFGACQQNNPDECLATGAIIYGPNGTIELNRSDFLNALSDEYDAGISILDLSTVGGSASQIGSQPIGYEPEAASNGTLASGQTIYHINYSCQGLHTCISVEENTVSAPFLPGLVLGGSPEFSGFELTENVQVGQSGGGVYTVNSSNSAILIGNLTQRNPARAAEIPIWIR